MINFSYFPCKHLINNDSPLYSTYHNIFSEFLKKIYKNCFKKCINIHSCFHFRLEQSPLSWTDQLWLLIACLFNILVGNRPDCDIKIIFFRVGLPGFIVISKSAFKVGHLFVPYTRLLMPTIVRTTHPYRLSMQICDSFTDFHIRSCLFPCIERFDNSTRIPLNPILKEKYSHDLWPDLKEDINGNCDGSFWLNDCLKYEIFLRYCIIVLVK